MLIDSRNLREIMLSAHHIRVIYSALNIVSFTFSRQSYRSPSMVCNCLTAFLHKQGSYAIEILIFPQRKANVMLSTKATWFPIEVNEKRAYGYA